MYVCSTSNFANPSSKHGSQGLAVAIDLFRMGVSGLWPFVLGCIHSPNCITFLWIYSHAIWGDKQTGNLHSFVLNLILSELSFRLLFLGCPKLRVDCYVTVVSLSPLDKMQSAMLVLPGRLHLISPGRHLS